MNFEEMEKLNVEDIQDLYGNVIEGGFSISAQYSFYCNDGSIHTINRANYNYCYRNKVNACWYLNSYDERYFCDSRDYVRKVNRKRKKF